MNSLISSINSAFKSIQISENDIQNVNGGVNEEMKLSGWMLVELNDEKCVMIEMNDRKEIEEGYLLNKEKVLERKGKELSETRNGTIDRDNGIRFDGRVFEGIPFGFGSLFDENGNRVYEGMMINWNRMGYGTSYNENGWKEYEGYWSHDMRNGNGRLFDIEGSLVYEGNWIHGNRIEDAYEGDGRNLSIKVKSLKLNDKSILKDFDISLFMYLEELIIGDECFNDGTQFVIDGMDHLKSIKIGMNSFTQKKNDHGNNRSCSFHVLNCAELQSIDIGRYSFSNYGGEFELKNLPSLTTIKIGEPGSESNNFFGSSFIIEGNIRDT